MNYNNSGYGGSGYPAQQPYGGQPQQPYGGQTQPPYGGQPGQQPPYGGQPVQQPPYGGQPAQQTPYGVQPAYGGQTSLGFDGLNGPAGMQNHQQSQSSSSAPYPNTGGGCQQPYGGQTTCNGQYPQSNAQLSYGGQSTYGTQQPSFTGLAYAASAAVSFQQHGNQQQAPPSNNQYYEPQGGATQQSYCSAVPQQHSISQPSPNISKQIPQEPATQGTVKDCHPFNPQQDAEVLRKAMKGFGTDEKAITQIVSSRSNVQRQIIKTEFATLYGKDLLRELKSELSGNYETAVLALFMKPEDFDAYHLFSAMEGVGTNEKALIEILCTRPNSKIHAASQAFRTMYKKDLEKEVISETSGHFRRLLVSLVQGARLEKEPLDISKAAADAKALYSAGEARWGTDESRFNVVLGSRSFPQLRLTFEEYRKISKRSMEQAIDSEMSGDLKDGMLAIVKSSKSRPNYFAERLYKSMKGLGTDDTTLIRIMVSRCEVDMVQIKQEFRNMYGKTLASFISDDCSGDYKKLLLQLCGGNN